MYQVHRRANQGFEDVMRELEAIESHLMSENRELGMNLMVVEAKIRERYQQMEARLWERYENFDFGDALSVDGGLSQQDIQAMIPRDLTMPIGRKRPTRETLSMAAVLAVITAAGVFGLASVLQLVLSYLA